MIHIFVPSFRSGVFRETERLAASYVVGTHRCRVHSDAPIAPADGYFDDKLGIKAEDTIVLCHDAQVPLVMGELDASYAAFVRRAHAATTRLFLLFRGDEGIMERWARHSYLSSHMIALEKAGRVIVWETETSGAPIDCDGDFQERRNLQRVLRVVVSKSYGEQSPRIEHNSSSSSSASSAAHSTTSNSANVYSRLPLILGCLCALLILLVVYYYYIIHSPTLLDAGNEFKNKLRRRVKEELEIEPLQF